mmetsp:Transcript_73901/g.208321  ORF Transcript_73901/g.208321 Transcript_73901/m.208321 type:complete len:346 (+) Transcript_73901:1348-2385(+)
MRLDVLLKLLAHQFAAVQQVRLPTTILRHRLLVDPQVHAFHELVGEVGSALEQGLHLCNAGECLAIGDHRHSGDFRAGAATLQPSVEGLAAQKTACAPVIDVKSKEVGWQACVLHRVPCSAPLSEEDVVVPFKQFGERRSMLVQPLLQACELRVRVPIHPLAAPLHAPPERAIERDAQVGPVNLLLGVDCAAAAAEHLDPLCAAQLVVLRGGAQILQVRRAGELELTLATALRRAEGILKSRVPLLVGSVLRPREQRLRLGQAQLLPALLQGAREPLLQLRALFARGQRRKQGMQALQHRQRSLKALQGHQCERQAARADLIVLVQLEELLCDFQGLLRHLQATE